MPLTNPTSNTADHIRQALQKIRAHGWSAQGPGRKGRDILAALPHQGPTALTAIRQAINPTAAYVSIIEWELQPGRLQVEVEAVLEFAIRIAEQEAVA